MEKTPLILALPNLQSLYNRYKWFRDYFFAANKGLMLTSQNNLQCIHYLCHPINLECMNIQNLEKVLLLKNHIHREYRHYL